MKKEYAWILRLGIILLIVAAVFSVANGKTALGILEFLAAEAGILAERKYFRRGEKGEERLYSIVGCISILLSLIGVAGILNHILHTGESLLQPVCITAIGASAAVVSFRKQGGTE